MASQAEMEQGFVVGPGPTWLLVAILATVVVAGIIAWRAERRRSADYWIRLADRDRRRQHRRELP